MYIVLRRYNLESAAIDEVLRRAQEGFAPLISKAPGFLGYYTMKTKESAISISIFQNQAGAEQSTILSWDWVKQNLAQFIHNPPEVIAGEATAFEP